MKLHLPTKLYRAVLACMVAVAYNLSTYADIPEEYNQVIISSIDDLERYSENDYIAYIFASNIQVNGYTKGAHQLWYGTYDGTKYSLTSNQEKGKRFFVIFSSLNVEEFDKIEVTNFSSTSIAYGGAIHALSGSVATFRNNNNIVIRGNDVVGGIIYGGAIYADSGSKVSFVDNNSIIFERNNLYASNGSAYGGAIYAKACQVSFVGNDSIKFTNNFAVAATQYKGGAIYATTNSNVKFSDGKLLEFSGNHTSSSLANPSYGGAVYAEKNSNIIINGITNVTFKGNYVKGSSVRGGAIYSDGCIQIIDNGNVTFRGNHEDIAKPSSSQLRSIYAANGSLTLAASENQCIAFYDSLYVSSTVPVSYNETFTNNSGVEQNAAGDIVFSGIYAKGDLKDLKADYTQQELTNSLTSEVYAMTHLYGGRLRIEDGAIYKGNGITAEEDSAATVRLQGGTLSHSGYKLTFNAGTTLEAQGVNSITASSLDLLDGSALTFTLGEANLTTAAVTLTGTFNQGGALTINLADDGTMALGNEYALLKISGSTATPTTWDPTKVTVNGLDADISDLSWSNGTLYLIAPLPELLTATWSGAESMVWNTTAKNWTQDGITYAYKDGVDVIFGNTGAGTVTLSGTLAPKSVLVDSSSNYTWSGSTGKLTGDMTLTKSGTGSLTISTANTYTGGTAINGGKVVAAHATALGTGVVTLGGGTLQVAVSGFNNAITSTGPSSIIFTARQTCAWDLGNFKDIIINDISTTASAAYQEYYGASNYASGNICLCNSSSVSIKGNQLDGSENDGSRVYGGALAATNDISFEKIALLYVGSNACQGGHAYGGAIFSSGTVSFIECDSIELSGNKATASMQTDAYAYGGAVKAPQIRFEGNSEVNIVGNRTQASAINYYWGASSTAFAGALSGNVALLNNTSVQISSNSANSDATSEDDALGGAISGGNLIEIAHNGTVLINDNSAIANMGAGLGGAIYTTGGRISIEGNDSVTFRGNYEKAVSNGSATYRLRSVYTTLGVLTLAAGEGQDITFYDTLYSKSKTVSFNADYEDKDGATQKATGDILFSGKYAKADLAAVKAKYTQQELTDSLTSEVYAMTHLYGGRLRVEDGAIYKGYGITAEVDSEATVRLQGGTLSHSGYKLTFNAGTTLEAQGVNSITASSLDLLDGSALTFTLGEANLTTAAVTLTGTFNQGGALTINLADDGTMELGNEYALLKISGSTKTPTTWNPTKVTVNGLDADINSLKWQNGTLYLGYAAELATATWSGSESMVWNTTAKNWTQDGYKYAYKDGVDVVFGNTGAGTVTLSGTLAPKSVLVDSSSNYTWSGSGKLTGDMTLTKSGTGSLTISTANTYTGGTAINGGKVVAAHATALGTGVVTLSNGTLEIAANGFANGISASGTSALRVADGYTLALSQMLANSGILTMSGTVNASALTLNTTAATHIDVSGQSGASGFAKSAYYSVQVVNGGTVGGNDAVITHINLPGTETLVLGADGYATAGGVVDYTNYLLTGSDTAATSAIHGVSGASAASVTQQGGTLTVDDAVTVATTAGTINLAGGTLNGTVSGATINAASGALNAALTGSNTLSGTNYALQSVVNNGGTLTMSGSFNASALTLDTTAATHIDVSGNLGNSGFAKDAIYSVTVANGTTVNNGATISHGTHNLVLGTDGVAKEGGTIDYSNYLLTGSDTAATSAIHAKGASATVTQTGGTLTVDDTVTVTTTAGTISLAGGTLNGTITNATINAVSGALNAALTGSNTLSGTNYALQSVVNNGGTLTMSGAFDASSLQLDTTAATHIDVSGKSGNSGFAKAAIYSVKVANGTTVNSSASITHGSHNLVLGTDGVAKVGGDVDYTNYLLTGSDTATTSAIHGKSASATVTQTGGTLTVDDTVTVATTSGTISLAGGTLNGTITNASINAASGTLNAALTGSNTLVGTNYALQSVVSNGGTLTMSGSFNASALTLDTTAATHVDVAGNLGNSGFAKSAIYSVTVANGTTVNSSASITHGSHNLVLGTDGVAKVGGTIDYSNYLLTGSDTATTSAIHGKGASATVTQTGGTLTVDDTVTVATTAGTISLAGGTLEGTITNATINAASGALNAALSGSNTLNGTNYALQSVVNNADTLTMSGSFDAAALQLDTTDATHVDVSGNLGNSGFAKAAIYSVKVANGTTVNSSASITHGSHNLVLGTDGVAKVGGDIDYTNYLLTGSDTAATSAIHGVSGASAASVTQQGGTLTVDDTVTVTTTAGSIILSGGTVGGTISDVAIAATSGVIDATVSGGASLSVTGGNVSVNGANSYTGGTTVTSGTLTLGNGGTLGTGNISLDGGTLDTGAGLALAGGQTLALNGGGMRGDLATAAGAIIDLNTSTAIDGDLTLSGGSILYSGAALDATGTVTITAATTLDVSGYKTEGTYKLLGYGSLSGDLGQLILPVDTQQETRINYSLKDAGTELQLTIDGNALELTWKGGSGEWKTLGEQQWQLPGSVTAADPRFHADDRVKFTQGGTVTITGEVKPGSVLVGGTEAVVFQGTGSITGATSLTKEGAGELTLNAANAYTGGTTVKAGTVHAGGVQSFGSGEIVLQGGTLDLGAHAVQNAIQASGGTLQAGAYAGTVTVGGNVQMGSGTKLAHLVVNSGSVTAGSLTDTEIIAHGGTIGTNVSGTSSVSTDGSVTISGANTYTGKTEVRGGTLTLTGSVTSDIDVKGGALAVESLALNHQALSLNGGNVTGSVEATAGSRLSIDSAASISGTLTLNGGTLALSGKDLTIGGNLVLASASVLDLSGYGTAGVYTLASYSGLSGDLNLLNIPMDVQQSSRLNYSLANTGTALTLTVDGNALTLTWKGGDGTWKTLGEQEWLLPASVTTADPRFHADDSVVFASGGTVTIEGDVKPGSVLVGGTEAVVFQGTGSIIGAGTLTKEGSGTLAMNAANSYSGGTTVKAGTVNAGGAQSFGSGDITLEGGTLNLGGHAVLNDIKAHGGTLTGTAYNGVLTVEGNLTVGENTTAKSLELTSGGVSGGSLNNVIVTAHAGSIASAITGGSSVTVDGNVTLSGDSSYTGRTTVTAGTLTAGHGNAFGAGVVSLENATLDLAGYAVSNGIQTVGGTLKNAQSYQGTLTVNGNLALTGATQATAVVLNTGSITGGSLGNAAVTAHAGSISSDITGVGSVAVDGDVTLSGSNTYNGKTTITAGKLTAGSDSALGAGNVSLEGGTLDLAGHALANNMTATGGTLAGATAYTGTLTVNGALQLGAGTTAGAITLNTNGSLNGGSVTGTTITANGGTIATQLTGANSIVGAGYVMDRVLNNSGTLTMSGSFDASALQLDTTDATRIDVNGQSGASGFAKDAIYAVTVANGTTVNNGATITHGTHNLVLGTDGVAKVGGDIDYTNYLLTGTDTASTAAIHAQGAGATVTQTGGTLTVDDTVTVTTTAGNISLAGGTLNGTVQGATINASSGALNAAMSGSNTLVGTNYALQSVVNNGGTLTMSGSFNAAALQLDTTDATHVDVAGNLGNSGFAKAAIYSVKVANGTTVNSSATITHGSHTLVLGTDGVAKAGGDIDYTNYLLTGSDTAATSAIHGKGAGATVTQTGGTLTVDDTVTVTTTAGAISLAGGTLNGTVSGATINASSGALNAALSGSNTLNGMNYTLQSVIDNSGALTLKGTLDLSLLSMSTSGETHVDVDGHEGSSGFTKASSYNITLVSGGTVANGGVTLSRGGLDWTLQTNGVATAGGGIDYSVYYLNGTDSAVSSAIHGVSGASAASVTQTGGTLTVDDTVTVTTTAGAISLAGGTLNGTITNATINAASGSLNAALSGSNTLNGTNYALQSVVNNAGTLTMSGSFNASALQLDTEAATHIDVNGQSGASGFAKDAIYAVTVANGTTVNSSATITHGTHNLVLGADGVAKVGGDIDYTNYLLTGTDTASTAAIHAQGAGATVTQTGGTLTVDDAVTVTTTAGTIVLDGGTLNGTVQGATINATSGALNATLNGENALHGNDYTLQDVVANNGTLTVSGTFDASALHLDTEAATHIDVNGQSGASGFAKDASYSVAIFGGTVVNDGATVTHGTHTLELGADGVAKAGGEIDYSDYLLTGTDTASTSDIHIIGPDATVTQQGGTLTVDDAVTVTTTAGTIVLDGGTLNGTITNATINATSGALNATLNGENALHGNDYALQDVVANNGTLTVSGTFDASALQLDTEAATHIDVNGQSGASGFAKDASYSVAIFGGTVVNDGAIVTHGTHTLELGADGVAKAGGEIDYSDYLLTGTDTASTSDIHIIGPDATVTQQGGTLTVDDAVTVITTAGTIVLDGGTLNGTVSGATINAVEGELNAALSGSNTLHGDNYLLTGALNNTGTLILEGTFELSTQLPEDVHQATHIDVNGQSGASGFAKAEQRDITIAIGGDIIADDAVFTRGGKVLTPGEDGKVISGGEIDYSNYLLTGTDTAASTAIHAIGPDATVTQTGGTLTVDDTVTVSTTAGTINLAGGTLNGTVSGATINATSGALNAALSGSNTLHGTNYVLQEVISNSGTLTMSGSFDASALHLDTEAATHIDVYGQSGANGFAKAVGYSVAVVNGGSVVNDGAEITHGAISLTLGTDGKATAGGEINYGTYYLHDGAEVAVSAIRTVPEAAEATVDMDGGLLKADADVEVASTGGRIEVSQDANVSGSIHDTQVAIRGCEISADITGDSTVTVEGETILSGHNTYTGDTDVMDGGMLKVTGSIISDVLLHGGIMDTAAGMALVDGQDVVFTGGNVRGNLQTVAGSGLNLEQNGLVDGDLTLGGGTLKLGDGCVLSVSGSLTLDTATTLVGDWQADEVYTLIVTGGVIDESGTASLNEFFRVSDGLGTVRMEGNTILLDTHTHHTADAMDTTLVNSLWASSSYIREFARLAEGQSYAVRRGETAVWGGGFGSFMNVSGKDGFTSDGAGYAFGVNHAFSSHMQAGVGLGQSFGSYHNKALTGAKVHQKGMMAAATAQYMSAKGGSFMLGGHAAVGRVRNNADTYLGGVAGKSRWDDTMLSLGARASYALHVTVDTVIAPFIGLDWMYGSQESFSDSHGRRYSNGKLSELRMPLGVTLRSSATIGSHTTLLPELSVAYVPSLAQDNPHADATLQGGAYRAEGYDPGRHGFMLNAGMNVIFSESWSAGAFYTLETRQHAVNQSANASLQYRF